MMRLSVADLIARPKTIAAKIRGDGDDPVHARLDLALDSDAPGKFQAFLRELFDRAPLLVGRRRGDAILIRVNGDHGRHRNPDGGLILSGPHVHGFRGPTLELPPRNRAEPRWAWPIAPDHLALPMAWRTFCDLANV